jgi:hypothetical protein
MTALPVNKTMKHKSLFFAIFLCIWQPCFAFKPEINRAYVQSMNDHTVFYARCIPDEKEGINGTTTIYRVNTAGDEKVDSYQWFSPSGVILAWNSLGRKVAVMSLRERAPTREKQIEFRFHLGGKLLQSYTTESLAAMGIEIIWTPRGEQAKFKVLGFMLDANTNEEAFVIESSNGKRFAFNIQTGKLRNP